MNKNKIIVASHERSGTHFLINTIADNFGYQQSQIDIDQANGYSINNPPAAKILLQKYQGLHSSYIFKTHHGYPVINTLMNEMLDEYHIFYIARDGKDVMTSFWHYLNSLAPGWGPRCSSVGEFMKAVPFGGILQYQHKNSGNMLQRWIDHSESWMSTNHMVTRITYEELYLEFDKTVGRIADLLGKTPAHTCRPGIDSPSSLPWKGKIGNWKDYFTSDDNDFFEANCKGHGIYTCYRQSGD